MTELASRCAVCRRMRTQGSRDETGRVFICVVCQSDAEQFLAIQDDIYDAGGGPSFAAVEVASEEE